LVVRAVDFCHKSHDVQSFTGGENSEDSSSAGRSK
jgi:hypothetical protein